MIIGILKRNLCLSHLFKLKCSSPLMMFFAARSQRNNYYCDNQHFLFLNPYCFNFRAQNLYRWAGQRRQNDYPLSVPHERGGSDVTNDRVQRGRSRVEKHPLYHVGPRRSRITSSRLEYVLL
jgi:hypothetical protein